MYPNLPEQQPPTPPQFRPDYQIPERKRYRFRWSIIVGIPLAIAGYFVVKHGIDPAFDVDSLLAAWNIRNPEKLKKLMILCVVLTFVLLTLKLFIKKPEK